MTSENTNTSKTLVEAIEIIKSLLRIIKISSFGDDYCYQNEIEDAFEFLHKIEERRKE